MSTFSLCRGEVPHPAERETRKREERRIGGGGEGKRERGGAKMTAGERGAGEREEQIESRKGWGRGWGSISIFNYGRSASNACMQAKCFKFSKFVEY